MRYRIALLALLVAGLLVVPSVASGASLDKLNITDGAAYKTPPADYKFAGELDPTQIVYTWFMRMRIRTNDVNGPIVRFGSDILDIDGDFQVNASDLRSYPNGFTQPAVLGDPLPDGKYYLEAAQLSLLSAFPELLGIDADADLKTTATFWVDSQLPETSIDSATPASPTNATTRSFTFSGTDPDPSSGLGDFQCQIDGGAWSACTSPFTTPTLAEGNHSFAVKAVDKAGNEDATPATASWMVDTTKPTIDLVTPPNGQHYELDQNVPANYTCDDPLSGGPPPVASGVASCVGTVPNGSPIDTETLGPHLFKVDAADNAGNTHSVTHAYVVDPPRYADRVLQDHPITYYRLGDPLGSGSMADSSGHGHDGEYKNGIALQRPAAIACQRRPHPPRACELTADPQDFAAFFPARDGYGYVNGVTAPQSAYSIDAWIKPADGGDMSIFAHGGGGQLFISGGHLALRQTQDTVVGGGPTLTPNQWWHVGASWDGHTTRLYVNGVEVGSSTTANKPPSGTSTLYVGYGDQAPWFHGTLDEVAYYDSALAADSFSDHYEIGTATDHPSLGVGPLNTAGPTVDPTAPKNNGLYAPGKAPHADFACDDPDGPADIASCTATVDGNPIADGDPLPDTPGPHSFVVTAVDQAGNTYVHPHTYTVKSFAGIFGTDNPIAYYRLGDPSDGAMADSSANGHNGEYKNRQQSGPVGIAGDGDHARRFFGDSGYGYVNGIAAPRYQATLEAWVNADDTRDQSILGHGDAAALFVRGNRFVFRHMDDEVTASVGPNPGTWQQVVATWDGVDIVIYVNGVERGRTEATKRPSSSSTFYVGYGEIGPWFAGSIDEVAYYDTALPAARVFQHFLADPPADLSVDTGSGTPATPPAAGGGDNGGGGGEAPAAPAGPAPSGDAPSGDAPSSAAPLAAAPVAPSPARTTTKKASSTKRSTAAARKRALARCKKRKGAKRSACVRRAKAKYRV